MKHFIYIPYLEYLFFSSICKLSIRHYSCSPRRLIASYPSFHLFPQSLFETQQWKGVFQHISASAHCSVGWLLISCIVKPVASQRPDMPCTIQTTQNSELIPSTVFIYLPCLFSNMPDVFLFQDYFCYLFSVFETLCLNVTFSSIPILSSQN